MNTVRSAVLALVISGLALVSAAPASSVTGLPVATSWDVPLARVTDAVVDSEHDQVFVSSRAEGRVAVVDLATGASTRLPHLSSASELALDDTGEFVWVSLRYEESIARISTTAPFDTVEFQLERSCPGDLVALASVVYVAVGACEGQWQELVTLDPATGEIAESDAAPFATVYNPALRAIPGSTRFHWQSRGISSSPSGIIDAADDTLVATTEGVHAYAAMPDGAHLLAEGGDLVSTSDLSVIGQVPMPTVMGADLEQAAVSDAGLLAFQVEDRLVVHDLADGTTVGTWQASATEYVDVERPLWDGDRLHGLGGSLPVQLLGVPDVAAPVTSVLDVDDPDPDVLVRLGSEVNLSGRLVDGTGSPVAGASLDVSGADFRTSTLTAPDGTWSTAALVDSYVLRVSYGGDATHAAAAAVVRYPIGTQPFLTVEAPATADPGDLLEYTGTVLAQDGSPMPGTDVNILWTCGERGFEGVAVTDDDGRFNYDTETPRCASLLVNFYVDGWHGSWGNSGSADTTTDIGWQVPHLEADGPEQLTPGESGTWTARLSVAGAPLAARVVRFSMWEGGAREAGTLTTDADGVARLTSDGPGPTDGGITFRYAGDATTLGASARVDTVVALWPSALTVAPVADTPVAREPLALQGWLTLGDGSSPAGRLVQATNEEHQPVGTSVVAADGSFELVQRPPAGPRAWTFSFAGDARHSSIEVVVHVAVLPQETTLTTVRAGSWPGRMAFRTTAEPGYAGMCVRHRVDRRTSEGWRKVLVSGCRDTGALGIAAYRTPPRLTSGPRYRIRPVFADDAWTTGSTGEWRRFRLS